MDRYQPLSAEEVVVKEFTMGSLNPSASIAVLVVIVAVVLAALIAVVVIFADPVPQMESGEDVVPVGETAAFAKGKKSADHKARATSGNGRGVENVLRRWRLASSTPGSKKGPSPQAKKLAIALPQVHDQALQVLGAPEMTSMEAGLQAISTGQSKLFVIHKRECDACSILLASLAAAKMRAGLESSDNLISMPLEKLSQEERNRLAKVPSVFYKSANGEHVKRSAGPVDRVAADGLIAFALGDSTTTADEVLTALREREKANAEAIRRQITGTNLEEDSQLLLNARVPKTTQPTRSHQVRASQAIEYKETADPQEAVGLILANKPAFLAIVAKGCPPSERLLSMLRTQVSSLQGSPLTVIGLVLEQRAVPPGQASEKLNELARASGGVRAFPTWIARDKDGYVASGTGGDATVSSLLTRAMGAIETQRKTQPTHTEPVRIQQQQQQPRPPKPTDIGNIEDEIPEAALDAIMNEQGV